MERTRDLLADATRALADAGVPSPTVDAELLLAHATGRARGLLRLSGAEADPATAAAFQALISQRARRIPLQHLTGLAPFRHLEVLVGPGVFIPRPETELIVDEVLRFALASPVRTVVDLCTGSGALAISLATELPGSLVSAVEVSAEALGWAQRNVAAHSAQVDAAGSDLTLVHADATTVAHADGALFDLRGRVDVVVTNPPYVPDAAVPREPEVRDHDPAVALYGGADGLDVVRALVVQAALLLRPGGLLVVEHADVQGLDAGPSGVPGVLAAHQDPRDHQDPHSHQARQAPQTGREPLVGGGPVWRDIADQHDLAGLPRHTTAIRTGRMSP